MIDTTANIETAKPSNGEIRRERPTSCNFSHGIVANEKPEKNAYPTLTPITEPTNACMLEQGIALHRVYKFHNNAESNIARKNAVLTRTELWISASKGKRCDILYATVNHHTSTPIIFRNQDRSTAILGFNARV